MGSYPRHGPNQARLRCHKVRHGVERGKGGRVDDVWQDRGGEYVKNINIKIRQQKITAWRALCTALTAFDFRPFCLDLFNFDLFWPYYFSTLWIFEVLNFDLLNFVHLIFRPYDFRAFDFSTWWFSCFWFFDHFVSTFWISGFCNSALCRAPIKSCE